MLHEVSESAGDNRVRPFARTVTALVLGALALPPNPNFATSGGHASPGDGFLILPYIFISLLVTVPLSTVLAGIVLFRKAKDQRQASTI